MSGNKSRVKNGNSRKWNYSYKKLEGKVLAEMMTKAWGRITASESLTEIPFERHSSLKGQEVGTQCEWMQQFCLWLRCYVTAVWAWNICKSIQASPAEGVADEWEADVSTADVSNVMGHLSQDYVLLEADDYQPRVLVVFQVGQVWWMRFSANWLAPVTQHVSWSGKQNITAVVFGEFSHIVILP